MNKIGICYRKIYTYLITIVMLFIIFDHIIHGTDLKIYYYLT